MAIVNYRLSTRKRIESALKAKGRATKTEISKARGKMVFWNTLDVILRDLIKEGKVISSKHGRIRIYEWVENATEARGKG